MITIEDWALRETIAIKDVEISQLKDEIRRLEEQLRLAQIDNNLLLQKEVALEAEVERMKKYKMFFESCSCFFAEGTEFMTKAEIYEAIKKETKNLK